jgi:CRP-like cAMP-binding protein
MSHYDPAVALAFFKAGGRPEAVPQGKVLFAEAEKARPYLLQHDKIYLLLDGEVSLLARRKVIGAVRKGEIFGEMAAINHAPRSATAVAKTACRVIALDDRQFENALGQKPEFALMLMSMMIERLRGVIARLKAANALSDEAELSQSSVFDPKRLQKLADGIVEDPPIYFDRRKPIIQEGQAGLFMYVVLEGTVRVSIGESPVERLGPGGVFGEIALVEQSPRIASVAAETDCLLLPIHRNAFLQLVRTSPEFTASVLGALAARLRYLDSRLG